jgi:hypothetical protein
MLAPSKSREISLSRFYVSCVSVFGTGRSLIPTILDFILDITFRLGKRGPWPFPREMRPAAWLQWPQSSVDGDNFPDLQMNLDSRIS